MCVSSLVPKETCVGSRSCRSGGEGVRSRTFEGSWAKKEHPRETREQQPRRDSSRTKQARKAYDSEAFNLSRRKPLIRRWWWSDGRSWCRTSRSCEWKLGWATDDVEVSPARF
eukprot:scaffold2846_cov322-Pavlova_lutheri.AAC.46